MLVAVVRRGRSSLQRARIRYQLRSLLVRMALPGTPPWLTDAGACAGAGAASGSAAPGPPSAGGDERRELRFNLGPISAAGSWLRRVHHAATAAVIHRPSGFDLAGGVCLGRDCLPPDAGAILHRRSMHIASQSSSCSKARVGERRYRAHRLSLRRSRRERRPLRRAMLRGCSRRSSLARSSGGLALVG